MHVAISIGNSQHLMASDCISSQGHVLNQGNNNYISITPDSREEADTLFNGLSEGELLKCQWLICFGEIILARS